MNGTWWLCRPRFVDIVSTKRRRHVSNTCSTCVFCRFWSTQSRLKSTKIDQKSTKSCHFVDMKSTKIDTCQTRVVRALFVVLVSVWCRLSTWCRQILVDFCRLFVNFGRFLLVLVDFCRLFCRHHVDTKICVETQSRHKFLCRHDVNIKIHVFCRFLPIVCWSDVNFGRSHVVDMCRTYNRQKSTSHIHNIDTKRQKSWILMSTSFRHKNLCRYHVDMKFHGFLSFCVDVMLIFVELMFDTI